MTAWATEELPRIGSAEELEITRLRRDDTLGSPSTICVVPHCDDLYVGSVNGPISGWYRGIRARHEGHIRARGADRDVTFVDAAPDISDELDAVDRDKRRYGPHTLDRITRPAARSTIIELIPR